MELDIAAFKARRPDYTDTHVREIAEVCTRDGIPFCVDCADWHLITDDHSED